MTIPLTGAGSLFVKLGHVFGRLDDLNAYRGLTAGTRVTGNAVLATALALLEADYAGGTAEYAVIDGLAGAVAGQRSSQASWATYLQGLCQRTLVDMANADTPLQTQTLATALALLVTQMTGVASVNASSPSAGAQTAVGSPTGDSQAVVSLKNGAGLTLQYVLPETLTLTCAADVQAGALVNRERFLLSTPALVGDGLSYLWPGGSGLNTAVNLVDCDQSNDGNNLAQNSGFETWTSANYPDNFVLANGSVAGTDILKETTNVYRATNSAGAAAASLKILGDGATLSTLRQPFNQTPSTSAGAGGTAYKLKPDTVYHVNYWYKLSNASPAAGALRVALVDGTSTVVNDDQSTANSNTVTLSGIGDTSWHNVNFAIRTPKNVSVTTAGNYKLEIKLTTALTAAKAVYLDCLSVTAPPALYPGGPYVSLHSGGTPPILADAWTVAFTNTYGAVQKWADRVFGLRGLGVQLPNSGAPTIADALIA